MLLGQQRLDLVDNGPVVERPVSSNGHVIALARMRPAPTVRTGAEGRFLADQYILMAAGGGGLMVLALITATWLARRWTKPLVAVQDVTRRLAQGELSVRLPSVPSLAQRSDEICDVIRNVNLMAEDLQKMEGARRRWLADISHELRTPLTVLRGDIEALHDGVRSLKPEAIGALHQEVLRLNRIVDDLHLLAIADLQSLPCHMADDDAVVLLHRLHDRYENRARDAGLSLRLQVPDGLTSLYVFWDRGRIEQLMDNLLENSLRYTHPPGHILLRLEYSDYGVRLLVEDSPPGVSAELMAQIFEPLYQVDTSRGGRYRGSGLGLAICQVIAKAHGGQLIASASALGGLTFSLEIPQTSGTIQPVYERGSS